MLQDHRGERAIHAQMEMEPVNIFAQEGMPALGVVPSKIYQHSDQGAS